MKARSIAFASSRKIGRNARRYKGQILFKASIRADSFARKKSKSSVFYSHKIFSFFQRISLCPSFRLYNMAYAPTCYEQRELDGSHESEQSARANDEFRQRHFSLLPSFALRFDELDLIVLSLFRPPTSLASLFPRFDGFDTPAGSGRRMYSRSVALCIGTCVIRLWSFINDATRTCALHEFFSNYSLFYICTCIRG